MVAQTTDPRTSFPELAAAKLGTGLVWEKPEFSLEINSFLACFEAESLPLAD